MIKRGMSRLTECRRSKCKRKPFQLIFENGILLQWNETMAKTKQQNNVDRIESLFIFRISISMNWRWLISQNKWEQHFWLIESNSTKMPSYDGVCVCIDSVFVNGEHSICYEQTPCHLRRNYFFNTKVNRMLLSNIYMQCRKVLSEMRREMVFLNICKTPSGYTRTHTYCAIKWKAS